MADRPTPAQQRLDLGPCAWCRDPAIGVVYTEDPVYQNRVLVRPGKSTPVCAHHKAWVERQKRRAVVLPASRTVMAREIAAQRRLF